MGTPLQGQPPSHVLLGAWFAGQDECGGGSALPGSSAHIAVLRPATGTVLT